ncbi:hypothetical protein [Methylobacterium nodulans]|uniref:Uncharacterized protein n=1 Tax=Methylobacterium nodulans (strain LMG 21967 / CNCM I-2342 / ORS 2060) TaxID=460265 RepID=B8IV40_METNO|nr:hypothetical protein [Methylobacterium nodulans]ACL59098.1 hypothetical protein Mnod_4222 [Methylobacterium nodulans ORS 2060]
MATIFDREIAIRNPQQIDMEKVWHALRGSPNGLRQKGLMVAVHNDYRLDGQTKTFWLMTWDTGQRDSFGRQIIRSFKGEGATDAEALDQIRAEFAAVTDNHKHAPLCPANHFHGARAPTGPCTCGAVQLGVFMHGARENDHG